MCIRDRVEEAAKNRTADDQRREVIEIKNEGDALAYQAEKLLNDLGEKVPSDQRGNVESKVNDLRDAIQSEDKNRMQRLIADLQADLQAIGPVSYTHLDVYKRQRMLLAFGISLAVFTLILADFVWHRFRLARLNSQEDEEVN